MSKPHSDTDGMPRVVVMCGVSGSGKTRYARTLESQGYERLSPDLIAWSRHGSALSSMPVERQREIFADANTLILQRLRELLAAGGKAVVDSTMCRRSKRDDVRRLCAEFGIEPTIVYMEAPLDVLVSRLASRHGSGPDDQIVPEHMLRRFFANFERPAPDEPVTVITSR